MDVARVERTPSTVTKPLQETQRVAGDIPRLINRGAQIRTGASPTRTERATRLRHTPRTRHRVAGCWSTSSRGSGISRSASPIAPGAASECVVRVELADGAPAVLKIGIPHRESEQEADALERWMATVRCGCFARRRRERFLLERCEPGTFLSASADDPLGVLIELLPRLWKDATGFAHARPTRSSGWISAARSAELARELARDAGRACPRPPGSPRRQRPCRRARAVARHRPEAARRGARVRRCADRSLRRARPFEARRPLPARSAVLRARLTESERALDDRSDIAWSDDASHPQHGEVVEWLS